LHDEDGSDDRYESFNYPYGCALREWVENNAMPDGAQLRRQDEAHHDEQGSGDDFGHRVRHLEELALHAHALSQSLSERR
jgi:hypothetical protein